MATEHEIKLVATLDTSRIKDQLGSSGGGMQNASSGGGMQNASSAAALAQSYASARLSQSTAKFADSVQQMQRKIGAAASAFGTLYAQIGAVNENIRSIFAHLRGAPEWAKSLSTHAWKLSQGASVLAESVVGHARKASAALDELADSANNAARRQDKDGGSDSLVPGGKTFNKPIGRFLGWGAAFMALNQTQQLFEKMDPERQTTAGKIFDKLEWANPLTFFSKMTKEVGKLDEQAKNAAESLREMQEFVKKLNDEVAQAKLNKYAREQKEALEVLKGVGLGEFVDEHRRKLEELKDDYDRLNDQIARRDVGRNIDELKKKMSDLNAQISVEQELYDAASNKMKQAADAAKKLAEETENLNKAFGKQQQQYQDTLDDESLKERRRGWKSATVDDLLKEKADANAEFNMIADAIREIDSEIQKLRESYKDQTTNEGRKNIIDKINELIGQRSRLSGQKGQARSDIDALNSIVKSFQDAADALKKKAQDLVDSEEFKQWQASLKGKSRQELDRMKKELQEERNARREEAIEAYTKGSDATDKAGQDYWRKIGEEAEKAMKDAETRIKEIESATKDGVKLDDPTDQMTSMGKMGMYMSMNEATLTDPKLEKLNHISLTLVQIERNTQQGTVSRFL